MLNPKLEQAFKDAGCDQETIGAFKLLEGRGSEKIEFALFLASRLFGLKFEGEPFIPDEQPKEGAKSDPVNHPSHYVKQAATIEPIEVLRFAPFDLGNALKYMIRAGHKENELQDLKKAEWYLKCAIKTQGMDHVPYLNFFNRYVSILQNFNGIPSDLAENCNCTYIEGLLKFVKNRIASFEREE